MDKEIWKDVKGYNGLYKVSNKGNVISYVKNKNGKLLKPEIIRSYYSVALSKNKTMKKHRIHRLVAHAFIDNQFNKPQVNHKNGNKLDNNVDNLEWCTNSENAIHAFKNGLRKPLYGINNPMYGMYGNKNPFYGKKHPKELMDRITKLNIGKHKGEKNSQAKLNDWDVKFIKGWIKEGYRVIDISKAFNISKAVISSIKVGRTWKHVQI
jgi:hypothetical protein